MNRFGLFHAAGIALSFCLSACGGGSSTDTASGGFGGSESTASLTGSMSGGAQAGGHDPSSTTGFTTSSAMTSSGTSSSDGGAGAASGGTASGGAGGTGTAGASGGDGGAGGATASGGGSASGGGGGGTGGGDPTCGCFAHARWTVDNLSPCFFTTTQGGTSTTVAVSTIWNGTSAACPSSATAPPTEPWSPDAFGTDCPGDYQLCVTLKAGDWHTPSASDCTMIRVCTQATVTQINMSASVDPLPGWLSDPSAAACVQQFIDEGGYGILSVSGTAPTCGAIPEEQVDFISYCPLACNGPNPPSTCAACFM